MSASQVRAPYPFAPAQGAELIRDAEVYWERLLHDISQAQHTVYLENFILRPGLAAQKVLQAMEQAAQKGAHCRLLVDAFGSGRLDAGFRKQAADAGIEISVFNPFRLGTFLRRIRKLLPRTHRRIAVIDDQVGWVGGWAIDDAWHPEGDGPVVRDAMFRFTGPAVSDLHDAFDRLWTRQGAGPRLRKVAAPKNEELRVIPQYTLRRPNYRRALHYALHAAEHRVWIEVPYFVPGLRLMNELRVVAQKGIDLRLFLPGPICDRPSVRAATRRIYGRLLRAGARIFEYQPAFLHSKLTLVDNNHVIVGSSNLDRWSLFINNEIGVALRSERIARDAEESMVEDMRGSREITLAEWSARPLKQKISERFFGMFDWMF
ncbi:MAG: phosphatidylserine/phosphatidylglycerophosphate/cardiolipin synthase family protein [Planctomycetes bacterium]|nr:phosphatidylserine/phosphatidylglycerophosphate/cardiolipin synthase family protein [Planctomycetota bacterium]